MNRSRSASSSLRRRQRRSRVREPKRRCRGVVTKVRLRSASTARTRKNVNSDVHTYESLRHSNRAVGENYIVNGLIRSAQVVNVSGRSGIGKSPLLYQAAICVADGVPFLDYETNSGITYVFDYENGKRQIERVCEAVRKHLGLKKVPDNLRIWTPDDGNDPLSIIRAKKPVLAIIDSLSQWNPECEDRNTTASKAMKRLREIARKTGCTIIVVHHLRKPSGDPRSHPPSLETCSIHEWTHQVRGASALINSADLRLGIDSPCRHQGDLVLAGFARIDGQLPKLCLRRVCDRHGEPLGYQRLSGSELLQSSDRDVLQKLNDEFTFTQAKYANGRGDQSTKNLLQRSLAAGVIEQPTPRGKYRKTEHVENGKKP